LLVGEIGIPRREFLYELEFWEVRRIIKGYRKRDTLTHQLIAECVYAATFAFRDPKGQTVKDIFPSLFQDEDEQEEVIISEEREKQLQAEMTALTAQYAKEKAEE
jgi:hypothetical protein